MAREIYFEIEFDYNTLETGIVLPAELKFGEETSDVRAKLDTGAAYCVFERKHGERLGLDIESGTPLRMSTATALSTLSDTRLILQFSASKPKQPFISRLKTVFI